MKTKTLLVSLIILLNFPFDSFSQITLDFEHTKWTLIPIKLSLSGWKYVDVSDLENNKITLYNLDNTVFRELTLPPMIDNSPPIDAYYYSETLFDTDSTTIEYYLHYVVNNVTSYSRIADENGDILLEEKDAYAYSGFTNGGYYSSIYNSDQGTKMQLQYSSDVTGQYYKTKIFSLPGSYTVGINRLRDNDGEISIFPNPSNGVNTLKLDPRMKLRDRRINIYDSSGRKIKSLKIEGNKNEIELDNSDLRPGMYLYQIISEDSFYVSQKKVLIVK